MFGNAKIWPYYLYNIKSWIFSYKVVKHPNKVVT